MNERWNNDVSFVQQLSLGLKNLDAVARPFFDGLTRFAQAVGPYVSAFVKYDKFTTSVEATGWLPYYTVPVSLIDQCGEDNSLLESRLSEFHHTKWPEIREDIESRLEGYCISQDAKAAFRQSLAAHERGLYICVSRTLFPEIDRALRIQFFEDAAGSLSSKRMLEEFTTQGSLSDFMPAEAHGWILFNRLLKHLFVDVDNTNRVTVAQDDLPTRHASIHGLAAYSTFKHSMNMIVMTDYIFQVISRLDKLSNDSSPERTAVH